MRDMASRIPEQLSAIGRDISRTIERAISAKDDYMLAVKVSQDAQVKLGQLVQAGVFGTRAEAAAFLIDARGVGGQKANRYANSHFLLGSCGFGLWVSARRLIIRRKAFSDYRPSSFHRRSGTGSLGL
jgi:hypothetical protein